MGHVSFETARYNQFITWKRDQEETLKSDLFSVN
jgi:hypothetical protein